MKTCPQCGGVLNPYENRCSYCGVFFWDLSAFDCTKQCYVKFKTHINGEECVVTALAQPKLEEALVEACSDNVYDGNGNNLTTYRTRTTCELKATFTCVPDPKEKTLFTVELPTHQN